MERLLTSTGRKCYSGKCVSIPPHISTANRCGGACAPAILSPPAPRRGVGTPPLAFRAPLAALAALCASGGSGVAFSARRVRALRVRGGLPPHPPPRGGGLAGGGRPALPTHHPPHAGRLSARCARSALGAFAPPAFCRRARLRVKSGSGR